MTNVILAPNIKACNSGLKLSNFYNPSKLRAPARPFTGRQPAPALADTPTAPAQRTDAPDSLIKTKKEEATVRPYSPFLFRNTVHLIRRQSKPVSVFPSDSPPLWGRLCRFPTPATVSRPGFYSGLLWKHCEQVASLLVIIANHYQVVNRKTV